MTFAEYVTYIIHNDLGFLGILFLSAATGFMAGYLVYLSQSDPYDRRVFTSGHLVAGITGIALMVAMCVSVSYYATSKAKSFSDKLNNEGYVLYINGQKAEETEISIKEIKDIMGDVSQDLIVDDQHKQILVSNTAEERSRDQIAEYWEKWGNNDTKRKDNL